MMNLDLPHDIEVGPASEEHDVRRAALWQAMSAYYLGGGTRTYVGACYEIVKLLGGEELADRMSDDPGGTFRATFPEEE